MDKQLGKSGEFEYCRVRGNVSFKSLARMAMENDSGKVNVANEPIHAALGKDLDENQMKLGSEESLIRNRALLHYMATLAISNSEMDKFNYDFVQSLLDGGANLNEAVDVYGQTIFHEVARSWNLDVARFLLRNGADVNQQDKFGRSALHVSAAADHCDMVEFLLQNGADIDSRSKGDDQTPLHFAAKNDAARSLKALFGFGANIDSLDYRGRTPLQVASELSRALGVRVLIEEGASSCIYDVNGSSAMTVLSEKLPQYAIEALDQLHVSDTITRCELFYLNLLEESHPNEETKNARPPLEAAVINRQFNLLMHPVMQRLIAVKWQQYGKFGTILDLVVNILYAILFTAFAVVTPDEGKELYLPSKSKSWRVLMGMVLILITAYQMYLQIRITITSRKKQMAWIKWRIQQLKDDLQYCHPKWQEEKYIRDEMKLIKGMPLLSTIDAWFFFDWLVILLILVTIALNLAYFLNKTSSLRSPYIRVLSILLVLVWIRILKYLRPFPGIGTLVLILGATGGDFVNWGFFFLLLFIPFSACFWIVFGGMSDNSVSGFARVPRFIYTMVQISTGEEFNLEGIVEADPVMARLLCSLYITAMLIVCLNILIAYLSNTFTTVYSNAVENTTMQRAVNILNVENFLTQGRKRKYFDYIRKNASPESVQSSAVVLTGKRSANKTAEQFQKDFKTTHDILKLRFEKRVARAKQSTFDVLLRDVDRLKINQNNTVGDLRRIQDCVEQLGLLLCGNAIPRMLNFHDDVTSIMQRQKPSQENEEHQKHDASDGFAFLSSKKNDAKKEKKATDPDIRDKLHVKKGKMVKKSAKIVEKFAKMVAKSDEMDDSDEDEDRVDDIKTNKNKMPVNLSRSPTSKNGHKLENGAVKKVHFEVDNLEDDSQWSDYEESEETKQKQKYSAVDRDRGSNKSKMNEPQERQDLDSKQKGGNRVDRRLRDEHTDFDEPTAGDQEPRHGQDERRDQVVDRDRGSNKSKMNEPQERQDIDSKQKRGNRVDRRLRDEPTDFDEPTAGDQEPRHGQHERRDQIQFQGRRHSQSYVAPSASNQPQAYTRRQSPRGDRRGFADHENTTREMTSNALVAYASAGNHGLANPSFTVDPDSLENWDYWERISADSVSL